MKTKRMSACIVTGGSGFVGRHLIDHLCGQGKFNRIYNIDINEPAAHHEKVVFIACDIRKPIDIQLDKGIDCCFHLAALAKEPGYLWEDYFRTNHLATRNLLSFCSELDINNFIFTSTMMVYAAGPCRHNEGSETIPDSAYGITKLLAELEIQRWVLEDPRRRTKIIRAAAVYGQYERGNFTRLFRALKRNRFAYAGRSNTIKAHVYVKDLVNFLMFCLTDRQDHRVYNLAYPTPYSINEICQAFCEIFEWKRYIPTVPFGLLRSLSRLLQMFPFRNDIHYRRIEKLYYDTNISSDRAIKSGFVFRYPLQKGLLDWKLACLKHELY